MRSGKPETEEVSTRGVREVDHDFPGVRTFHVISAKGEKQLQVSAPAADVDDRLMAFLEEWLNDHDRQIFLVKEQPTNPPQQTGAAT